ncbi:MAG: metallophosphoesterase, partial [Coriobacteriales bacterium]|nr:metallophosphoesterase [Coriobacteriales bacterium]
MPTLKPLVLLHSNDMHGDFLAEKNGGALTGGISRLSGYVEKVRRENPNVLYCIAGDMLQGSLIDSEFKGISTISIMNLLHPDIVSLGNHEVDYGLAHLLFLERCAAFPIVNANLFIKNPYTRLFAPYKIFKRGGMRIMFIGIITEEVLAGIKSD